MTHMFPAKLKVTDGERYDRFVAATQQIGALNDAKNFEKAFQEAFKTAFEKVSGRGELPNTGATAALTATEHLSFGAKSSAVGVGTPCALGRVDCRGFLCACRICSEDSIG